MEISKKINLQKEICPICLEKLNKDIVTTECNHSFCKGCFDKLKKDSCPLCRRENIGVKVHRLVNVNIYEGPIGYVRAIYEMDRRMEELNSRQGGGVISGKAFSPSVGP